MPLADILALEPLGGLAWRAHTPENSGRGDIYGGQVAGQALRAAQQTVEPAYSCNAAHCLFLRRGNPTIPLDLHVTVVRTGRTYATRQVEVVQDDKPIFTMLASFHTDEPGREHHEPMPAGVPDPDELPAEEGPPGRSAFGAAMELRNVEVEAPLVRWWARIPPPFPADLAVRQCALLYASDMRAGGAAMSAVGYSPGPPPPGQQAQRQGNFGSLDHAIWFHRPPVVDEWFFCEIRPLTVRDSRGLVLGTMFDRAGAHLATFTQEVFLKAAAEGAEG